MNVVMLVTCKWKKANRGCRICTCACIRSEPTVQLVYVCRRVPCIFGIIIVRQPGRCVAARHDSVRDLKYSRTLGYTHIWITKQGVFIGRKSCWSKRIRVRILDWPVSRERCNGALSCWAHVSGIACEKEINYLQHRILVGLVSAHCLARRGFIYLVYGVEVQRRTVAPNISLGCNKQRQRACMFHRPRYPKR
jgi:hypothetical protein